MDRKQTAWKKNRKLGDVYGGREAIKLTDGIFQRLHSLKPLGPHDERPKFIIDNPSRDFFHPLSPEEVLFEFAHLPTKSWKSITHVWFRRFKKTDYEEGELPFAEFVCGSGVRAIVLYPWPIDQELSFGTRRPTSRQLKMFSPYTNDLVCLDGKWRLNWSIEAIKKFYIEVLLYHEIGHNLDWYHRRWTVANRKQAEEFADQFAYKRTSKRTWKHSAFED